MKPELFMIDVKAVQATNIRDVIHTYNEMIELGIALPPSNHLVIGFDPRIYASSFYPENIDQRVVNKVAEVSGHNPGSYLAVDFKFSPPDDVDIKSDNRKVLGYFVCEHFWINGKTLKPFGDRKPGDMGYKAQYTAIFATLIVLLATKNAEKDRVENRPNSSSAKARNASKNFAYTTTIRIGKITENCKSGGTGSPTRPHLRRGHVRNQRYGEGRREIKQIFIAPVFINADKEYVESQRIAYKIRA